MRAFSRDGPLCDELIGVSEVVRPFERRDPQVGPPFLVSTAASRIRARTSWVIATGTTVVGCTTRRLSDESGEWFAAGVSRPRASSELYVPGPINACTDPMGGVGPPPRRTSTIGGCDRGNAC